MKGSFTFGLNHTCSALAYFPFESFDLGQMTLPGMIDS